MAKKKTKIERRLFLDVEDRLRISTSILPQEDNIINLMLARDITHKVEFGQAEVKKIGLKSTKSGFTWNNKKCGKKTFEFTDAELELMSTQINKLDSQSKITPDLLSLCLLIREKYRAE